MKNTFKRAKKMSKNKKEELEVYTKMKKMMRNTKL